MQADVSIRFAKSGNEEVERVTQIVNRAYREDGNWTTEVGIVSGQRVRAPEIAKILHETEEFCRLHPEVANAASGGGGEGDRAPAIVGPTPPHTLVLVAELASSSEIVGCIEVTTTDAASAAVGAPSVHGYLGMLAVDRQYGSRGVGRALMSAGERVASSVYRTDGVVLFVLSCRTDILAWYHRRGYADTGLTHQAHEIIASCDPEGQSKLLIEDAFFRILLRRLH